MAWTEADRDALKKAIVMGVRVVSYADRRQEYRSLEEMKEILAMIDDELEEKPAVRDRGRRYAACSSGIRA